jgi:hypothetical protein
MNVQILNNLLAQQICNEKKTIDWTNKKVETKWNQIQIEAQHFKKE